MDVVPTLGSVHEAFAASTEDRGAALLATIAAAAAGNREAFARLYADYVRMVHAILWHLLARVDAVDRGRVFDALAARVPPPAGVTREAVLRLDRRALDGWWNALGLGDATWWRNWRVERW